MAKIREDLCGVVYADGQYLRAGETVPSGVKVDKSLLAVEKKPAVKKPAVKKQAEADGDES